jgi:hypothetical protein
MSLTEILAYLGSQTSVSFDVKITDNQTGEVTTSNAKIETHSLSSINKMIVVALINKAITGDVEAIRLYHEITSPSR